MPYKYHLNITKSYSDFSKSQLFANGWPTQLWSPASKPTHASRSCIVPIGAAEYVEDLAVDPARLEKYKHFYMTRREHEQYSSKYSIWMWHCCHMCEFLGEDRAWPVPGGSAATIPRHRRCRPWRPLGAAGCRTFEFGRWNWNDASAERWYPMLWPISPMLHFRNIISLCPFKKYSVKCKLCKQREWWHGAYHWTPNGAVHGALAAKMHLCAAVWRWIHKTCISYAYVQAQANPEHLALLVFAPPVACATAVGRPVEIQFAKKKNMEKLRVSKFLPGSSLCGCQRDASSNTLKTRRPTITLSCLSMQNVSARQELLLKS